MNECMNKGSSYIRIPVVIQWLFVVLVVICSIGKQDSKKIKNVFKN